MPSRKLELGTDIRSPLSSAYSFTVSARMVWISAAMFMFVDDSDAFVCFLVPNDRSSSLPFSTGVRKPASRGGRCRMRCRWREEEEKGDSQRKDKATKCLRPGQAFLTGLPSK